MTSNEQLSNMMRNLRPSSQLMDRLMTSHGNLVPRVKSMFYFPLSDHDSTYFRQFSDAMAASTKITELDINANQTIIIVTGQMAVSFMIFLLINIKPPTVVHRSNSHRIPCCKRHLIHLSQYQLDFNRFYHSFRASETRSNNLNQE